jgi:hypothetical protein
MRVIGLLGLLLALAGCASERNVVFLYSPVNPDDDRFPKPYQFAAEAQRECGRYNLTAVHLWDSAADFNRVRSYWKCVTPTGTVPSP